MSEEKTQGNGFLPLGSIVILKGTIKKLMIVVRANVLEGRYFDYGGILYPEGVVDGNIAYFNKEDIVKTVWEGFTDDDDALVVEQIMQAKKDFPGAGADTAGEAANRAESIHTEETGNAAEPEGGGKNAPDAPADPFAALKEMEGDEE